MNSVGHRKIFEKNIEYLKKIFIDNQGRKLSIIRKKLAGILRLPKSFQNFKRFTKNNSKKIKSLCDVIEEETIENNLKSLPDENLINSQYNMIEKEIRKKKSKNLDKIMKENENENMRDSFLTNILKHKKNSEEQKNEELKNENNLKDKSVKEIPEQSFSKFSQISPNEDKNYNKKSENSKTYLKKNLKTQQKTSSFEFRRR